MAVPGREKQRCPEERKGAEEGEETRLTEKREKKGLNDRFKDYGEDVKQKSQQASENVKMMGEDLGNKIKETDVEKISGKCREKSYKAGEAIKSGAADTLEKTKDAAEIVRNKFAGAPKDQK